MAKKIRSYIAFRPAVVLIVFCSLLVMLIGGCIILKSSEPKSFYDIGSDWDYVRFPILEPYYAMNISDENGWVISLYVEPTKRTFRDYIQILQVTKIAVENDVIMVYSSYTRLIRDEDGKEKELHWFILIPNQAEIGFETEKEFMTALPQYGIEEPAWQEPLALLKTYNKTGCLDWFPDCK